jgi:formate-dependent nitrite reductase cytochrome c552 subunit
MTMKRTQIVTGIVGVGMLLAAITVQPVSATEAYAKKENLTCTACHDKPGSKLLTDKGKYYELMHTLSGFDDVKAAFGQCTTCHVRKPGSKRLTATGRNYKKLIHDMKGLRDFLNSMHPRLMSSPADDASATRVDGAEGQNDSQKQRQSDDRNE